MPFRNPAPGPPDASGRRHTGQQRQDMGSVSNRTAGRSRAPKKAQGFGIRKIQQQQRCVASQESTTPKMMKSHCLVVFVFPVSEFQMKFHEGRKSVVALKTKMIHFTQCYVRLFNENALKKSEMQRGKKICP